MKYILLTAAFISFNCSSEETLCITQQEFDEAFEERYLIVKNAVKAELNHQNSIDNIERLLVIRNTSQEPSSSEVVRLTEKLINAEYAQLRMSLMLQEDDENLFERVGRLVRTTEMFLEVKEPNIDLTHYLDTKAYLAKVENSR